MVKFLAAVFALLLTAAIFSWGYAPLVSGVLLVAFVGIWVHCGRAVAMSFGALPREILGWLMGSPGERPVSEDRKEARNSTGVKAVYNSSKNQRNSNASNKWQQKAGSEIAQLEETFAQLRALGITTQMLGGVGLQVNERSQPFYLLEAELQLDEAKFLYNEQRFREAAHVAALTRTEMGEFLAQVRAQIEAGRN